MSSVAGTKEYRKIVATDTAIVIVILLIGFSVALWGDILFSLSEIPQSSASTFIFAVDVMYFTVSIQKWKKAREDEKEYQGILNGIYKEIVERTRILQGYLDVLKIKGPAIVQIAPFPASAWDTAIAKGYYQPNNLSWVYYAYVYNATDNINRILEVSNKIAFSSTLSVEISDKILHEQCLTVLKAIDEAFVIIDICTTELEEKLGITREEVRKANEEIRKQIKKAQNSYSEHTQKKT